ncbi:MAG: Uma2 family endonuclease [Planctomycetota bacterium]
MTALPQRQPISVEEYLAGELDSEVRHEFVDGYVYAMAGARNQHNIIATNLLASLHSQLRGQPCQPFNSDTKARIQLPHSTRFYYPDCMVICQETDRDESYQDFPVVIAEVISEKTRRVDEEIKRDNYLAMPTVRVYLLVEQNEPRVVAYRRGETGFAREFYEGLSAVIPLAEVEVELPLAELYERIDFSDPDLPDDEDR